MRYSAFCCAVLTALTLGAGLVAVAYQTAEPQELVDPPMEQARHLLIDHAETDCRHQPVIIAHYTADDPASSRPILCWSRIDGAVMYDVQVVKRHGGGPSPCYEPVMAVQRVYNTACEILLPAGCREPVLYWRVKPLNLRGQAIGPFSELEPLPVDWQKQDVVKPVPLSTYNQGQGQTLLYPVYDWIAMPDADHYEVEILDAPPENPNGTAPSAHRIAVYTTPIAHQYDSQARMSAQPFYWRVRAVRSDGSPLGVYSDASSYTTDPSRPCAAAIYGDSISHGGGSVSYSPADWEFTAITSRSLRSTCPSAATRAARPSSGLTRTSRPSGRRTCSSSWGRTASAPASSQPRSSPTWNRSKRNAYHTVSDPSFSPCRPSIRTTSVRLLGRTRYGAGAKPLRRSIPM